DLLADPAIRTRYQIWAFRYPTGDPILVSASRFRAALAEARKTFDPDGKSRALRHMVVVGHSMGGLLASLQVRASAGRLWDRVSSTPFEDLGIPEEDRAFLRPLFFFERNPDIRRVVFLATPHRGTEMAEGFFARLGSSLVRVAGQTGSAADALRKALSADPGRRVPPRFLESMTGIDGLRPDNPFLGEIVGLPFPADVAAHSILGNREAAGAPGGTDGVVPYGSAHLEGVKTERIVKSEHDVQVRPETIGELRRILREHLAEFDAGAGKQAP
ncbi:MAG TPA: alpha/beta hydrolase, partial [Candidatus Methylomirabilis sp.]|nr:alpha/beta hydrolase [Candidatus Methylomirabilis sp.]